MQNKSESGFSEQDWAVLFAQEEPVTAIVQVGGQAALVKDCDPASLVDHICRVLEQVSIRDRSCNNDFRSRFRKRGAVIMVLDDDDEIVGEISLADLEAVVKHELTKLRQKAINQIRQQTLDLVSSGAHA